MAAPAPTLTLRNARLLLPGEPRLADLAIEDGRIRSVQAPGNGPRSDREADLGGRWLLPGLLNGHDHLDLSVYPALGRPTWRDGREWTRDVEAALGGMKPADLPDLPLVDRLFLGGLRNLLAGATAVAHHGAYHRSLGRSDFPVRVPERYQFARMLGSASELRKTYRTTDRRIPWMVHGAEGAAAADDVSLLAEAGLLRHNTVVVGGAGIDPAIAARLAAAEAVVIWCPEADLRLYGRTLAPAVVREARVKLGLGSESPLTGTRDALSSLAVAARQASLAPDQALRLSIEDTAVAARLVKGGVEPGDPADLLATASLEVLCSGVRPAIDLVVVAGRARYGETALMRASCASMTAISVDGAPKALDATLARRAAVLVGRTARRQRASWLGGVAFA